MSDRDRILAALKESAMHTPAYERIDAPVQRGSIAEFSSALKLAGGSVVVLTEGEPYRSAIQKQFPEPAYVIDCTQNEAAADLNDGAVDVAVVNGLFGVSENGAVFVSEREMSTRSIPFIAEHLVVLLDMNEIVLDMHSAYGRISTLNFDYGIFISGPSKTADIEQALVIGAHGPKSVTVILHT